MEKQDVFVSLFDFLGKPAGTELGKAVYMSAKNQRQVTKMREVSNKKYTGKVVLYKPEFLEEYFYGKK